MRRFPFVQLAVSLTLLVLAAPSSALTYTYDNTTSGSIPELGSNAACNGATALVRTFTVSESFTVAGISLGLNLTHADRGHVRAILNAPDGSNAVFVSQTGAAGDDPDDNYDILISTNTEGALDDGDVDPTAAPIYNRLVSLAGANFYAGNANGTWTLRVCDRFTAGGLGTFNQARLVLTSAETATSSCTSTTSYDWGANGNDVAFTSAASGDVTISLSTSSNYGSASAAQAFTTRTTTQGNHTGYYALAMDAATAAGTIDSETIGQEVTFTFSQPIRDLSFSLLDVDWTNNAWEDQAYVIALDPSGNPVPYAQTFGTANQQAGNLGEGDVAAATTDPAGNVGYVFSGQVSSVTIHYSQGNEPTTESVFMIIGISDFTYCAYDYGDAPSTYGTNLGTGARHALGARNLYLGTNPPDGEADGQAGAGATTDDTTQLSGADDEDGVASFPSYTPGSTTYTVSVEAKNLSTSTGAFLVGYIDWNRDGDFGEANERSATVSVPANTSAPSAAFNVTWSSVPIGAGGTTATFARFRIAFVQTEVESPTGAAASGEIEDYPIPAGTLPVTLASFEATPTRSGFVARWSTETETSTVGYRLLGWSAAGWQKLHEELVATDSPDSLAPQRYELELRGELPRYLALEDLDLSGTPTLHGPFEPGVTYGRAPEPVAIDWAEIQRERAALRRFDQAAVATAAGFPVAELRVDRAGIQRLRFEDLLAAGLDFAGAPVALLGLSEARTGKTVPIHVEAGTATPTLFGPGGFVEFVGEPRAASLYGRERHYRLAVLGQPGLRARLASGQPQGATLAGYTATVEVHRDRAYSPAAPNGDPWYDDRVLAQRALAEKTFTLEVDHLAGDQARLEVDYWGVTNWPGSAPDHHVQVLFNGVLVADEWFDGLITRNLVVQLPAGLLRAGANELTLRLPGDTGFDFDLVHLDRFRVRFPRAFVAASDALRFIGRTGRHEVQGLSSPQVAVWAQSGRVRLTGFAVTPSSTGYTASFSLPPATLTGSNSTRRVDLAGEAELVRPSVAPARAVPAGLLTESASYLIVAHAAFADGLGELIAARQAQGLSVQVVDVEDLYAAFTGGEPDPEAIRSYLRTVGRSARFVLLVGGDTYDYLDHLGLGSVSFVPTPYAQTDDLISFTPADSLYADLDGDGTQDLALGRLPVRARAELEQAIAKTLAFPSTPRRAVLASDASELGAFAAQTDQLAARLPAAWSITRADLDALTIDVARTRLLTGINAGAALVNFVGHSGPSAWTFRGLFSAADAENLANTGAPSLVVQSGCWNTYHVSPQYDTLSHRLMLAGPQGAAAALGSATLAKTTSDALLGPALTAGLTEPGNSVGEALVAAKRSIARQGGDLRDVLLGWTLLGDPALVLVPEP
jgi:subtilisin-like proprotein convertase family protein